MISIPDSKLRLAVEAAKLGFWFVDPKTMELDYTQTLANIYGYDRPEKMTFDQTMAQITPGFRTMVYEHVKRALEAGSDYEVVFSFKRFDNHEIIWVRAAGKIVLDEQGKQPIFSGSVANVTELRKMQAELLKMHDKLALSEEFKGTAIRQVQLGTWHTNIKTRKSVVSDRLKEILGFNPEHELDFDEAVARIHPDYRDQVLFSMEHAINHGGSYDLEYPLILPGKRKMRWVRASGRKNVMRLGGEPYFSGTMMDITEQKEREIRKNDFISMVSHELKSPLSTLNGYLQLLQQKAADDNSIYLEKAQQQLQKMNSLIDGFLNMNRPDTCKLQIDKTQFDMAALIREIIAEANISSHRLLEKEMEGIYVFADRMKIGQVIENLISNAVKYSPPGGQISLRCQSIGPGVKVSISDQGYGIDIKDQEQLFERFYRVRDPQVQNIGGFGIGLYLCSEIIQHHGGKIWVESEVGSGSTFAFIIPLHAGMEVL